MAAVTAGHEGQFGSEVCGLSTILFVPRTVAAVWLVVRSTGSLPLMSLAGALPLSHGWRIGMEMKIDLILFFINWNLKLPFPC